MMQFCPPFAVAQEHQGLILKGTILQPAFDAAPEVGKPNHLHCPAAGRWCAVCVRRHGVSFGDSVLLVLDAPDSLQYLLSVGQQ